MKHLLSRYYKFALNIVNLSLPTSISPNKHLDRYNNEIWSTLREHLTWHIQLKILVQLHTIFQYITIRCSRWQHGIGAVSHVRRWQLISRIYGLLITVSVKLLSIFRLECMFIIAWFGSLAVRPVNCFTGDSIVQERGSYDVIYAHFNVFQSSAVF